MKLSSEHEIQSLYERIIHGWNIRSAEMMSEQFDAQGELIGFDGSQVIGRNSIFDHLYPIFEQHPTPPFVSIVKNVRLLSSDVALLRAIVGMIPDGKAEINPKLNAHQTLIAVKRDDVWLAQLFQNTPAQFHGRPNLVVTMTEELIQASKNKKQG